MPPTKPGSCLFPLTISVDNTMDGRLAGIWTKIREIGTGRDRFKDLGADPFPFPFPDDIRNQRDTVFFLKHTVFYKARLMFDGLMEAANTIPPADESNEQRFLRALQHADRTTVSTEDTRQLIPTHFFDAEDTDQHLRYGSLYRDMRVNRAAHAVLQPEFANVRAADRATVNEPPPTREAIKRARKKFGKH